MAIRNVALFAWGRGSYAELAPPELTPPPPGTDIQNSIDTYGRRETFIDVSQIEDGIQAFWLVVANLYPLFDGETSVSATYEPTGVGDVPFVDYNTGDVITVTGPDGVTTTTIRVVAIAGKRSKETGRMVYTPTFQTQQESADTRTARWLQRATIGTMGGRSTNAVVSGSSVVKKGVRAATVGPTFNGSSIAVGDESSPWTSTDLVKVTRLEMESSDTGLAASTAELWVNGVLAGSLTLNIGVSYIESCVGGSNIYIPPRTPVVCKCTAIGHPGFTFRAFVAPVNK